MGCGRWWGGLFGGFSIERTVVTSGPLTAPSTATITGGNGVYAYGGTATAGIFPTNTYGAANYFADVVFGTATTPNAAPTAVADFASHIDLGLRSWPMADCHDVSGRAFNKRIWIRKIARLRAIRSAWYLPRD